MANEKITYMKLSEIEPYENNPRFNEDSVDRVANSIKAFGFKQPIVVDANNVIIAGHTRYKAAKQIGLSDVPVIVASDLSEDEVKAYRLADNKVGEASSWDFEALNIELSELMDFDMGQFGFEFDSIEEASLDDIVEDEVPEVDEESEPTVKLGEVWQLGRHRLMCGDSTSIEDVQKLMGGQEVDMVFTDPPYNVAFNGRSGKFDVIENDNLEEEAFEDFITSVCNVIKSIDPKCYYIWCNWKFYSTLQTKMEFKSCIVWAKNVFGLGNGYRHQHEFCLFNGKIDDHIKNESDLWEVAKDTDYVHPTQKPVSLCGRALKNHRGADVVLDLFGGSGSTLIACEQLDRTCYMMEIDPKYCDVIIKRWENLSGESANLIKEA